MVMHLDKKNHR